MKTKHIVWRKENEYLHIRATGTWILSDIDEIEREIASLPRAERIRWDVSQTEALDSAGILCFAHLLEAQQSYAQVEVTGYTPQQEKMYRLLVSHKDETIPERKTTFFERIGKHTIEGVRDLKAFVDFLGRVVYTFFYLLRHPGAFRYKETVYHIYQSGFSALVIVGMTAFLVGMVIAYQGAVQLAKFGADIFIVDTVGISMTRELGPMITAIVIAGRSGSAYTAEIGAMKITEEIAAMQTMGFDPYNFLVLPRIVALTIALPLLIFFADIVGIFGGIVASTMELGISFDQFVQRLNETLEVKHYILGMIKGPVFAFAIAAIGCFRGFRVSDNTESIGLHTTASVVNAIFTVIAFDALFSVFYTEMGW